MSFAAAVILATTAAPASASGPAAQARVTVTIVRPAAVRQASGPVGGNGADLPRYQLTRRGRAVLVEFQ